jgi:putative photosynthetic complex assembly protein 2
LLHHGAAVAFVILAWWLSTGAILHAAGRERPNVVPLMAAATLMAVAGFFVLWRSTVMDDLGGVYLGFLGALAIWGWHEASFLSGVLTGPMRDACPKGAVGYERFRAAFLAIRDHELAIAATALVIVAISIGGDNRVGMWTFLLLWAMRITAKLVLFLGAPHVAVHMLPKRLSYIATYFRTDRVSAAFPAFIAGMLVLFAFLCMEAVNAPARHLSISATVLAAFLALAIIEHLLLVLPISDAALWRWAMPDRERGLVPEPRAAGIDLVAPLAAGGSHAVSLHTKKMPDANSATSARRPDKAAAIRVQSGGRK